MFGEHLFNRPLRLRRRLELFNLFCDHQDPEGIVPVRITEHRDMANEEKQMRDFIDNEIGTLFI